MIVSLSIYYLAMSLFMFGILLSEFAHEKPVPDSLDLQAVGIAILLALAWPLVLLNDLEDDRKEKQIANSRANLDKWGAF